MFRSRGESTPGPRRSAFPLLQEPNLIARPHCCWRPHETPGGSARLGPNVGALGMSRRGDRASPVLPVHRSHRPRGWKARAGRSPQTRRRPARALRSRVRHPPQRCLTCVDREGDELQAVRFHPPGRRVTEERVRDSRAGRRQPQCVAFADDRMGGRWERGSRRKHVSLPAGRSAPLRMQVPSDSAAEASVLQVDVGSPRECCVAIAMASSDRPNPRRR